jgi:hypothetical protein
MNIDEYEFSGFKRFKRTTKLMGGKVGYEYDYLIEYKNGIQNRSWRRNISINVHTLVKSETWEEIHTERRKEDEYVGNISDEEAFVLFL